MISLEKIAVIVQGPVVPPGKPDQYATCDTLKSARHLLPGAQIILSTWENSDVTGLDFDTLVTSQDPGSFPIMDLRACNINRQITSTREGLRKANRPYAVKLRSDCLLENLGFLNYWEQFPDRSPDCQIFARRIAACACYFRNPAKREKAYLFHPSDIFQFGLTTDLLDLWDIPLANKNVCVPPARPIPFLYQYEPCWYNKVEEQYGWLECLNKHGVKADLKYAWEFSLKLANLSELSMANNFVVMSMKDCGVKLPSKISRYSQELVYKHEEWLGIYHLFCSQRRTPIGKWLRDAQLLQTHFHSILNHLYHVGRHYLVRALLKLKDIFGIPTRNKPKGYPLPFAPAVVYFKGVKFPMPCHLNDNYEYPEWILSDKTRRPYDDAQSWWVV